MKCGEWMGCHQMPERSFFFHGHQFPICARCTGVLIGQTFAAFTFLFVKIKNITCLLLALPMAIDWGMQYVGIKASTNVRRLITGILGGFGLALIYFRVLRRIIKAFRR
jgi:uncharacterized membrane protein